MLMTWKQWMVQGIITVALAAVAAFAGINAGLATAQTQIAVAQSQLLQVREDQLAFRADLIRIEGKLDRLIERRYGREIP